MSHVIGVDVGSQSVKAVLCGPDGATLATSSYPCTMSHPRSGWCDQDPAEWEHGVAAAVRAVRASAGVGAAEVTHIGLACQVDGVVPAGPDLRPLRSAIIWLDKRAVVQADRLAERVGTGEIFAISGLNADASHTGPKMMWLRDEEPAVFAAASLLLPVAGYLVGWLTGRPVQDHANASSTLLYDVRARDWSPVLLAAADLDPGVMPPLAAAHEIAGTLTPAAAELLDLTPSCAVVAGTGDDHAAALGAGVTGGGVIADVTGTAEPVAAASDVAVFDAGHLVETHAHAADGVFLVENPGFVSGGSTMWLASLLGVTQREVFDWARAAPPASDGVTFVPALSGATAPRWNHRMRGAFSGLSMNHDHGHLSRSVLEGCAYALRDITDRLRELSLGGQEIRVIGGGSRSPLWMQIKADVTGIGVRAMLDAEPTALGAAMLAAVGAGRYAGAAEAAAAMARPSDTWYRPDPAAAAACAEGYARYRGLFGALEEITS